MSRSAEPRSAGRVRGPGPSPLAPAGRSAPVPAAEVVSAQVPGHDFGRVGVPSGAPAPRGEVAAALTRPAAPGGGVVQRVIGKDKRLQRLVRSNQRGLLGTRKMRKHKSAAFGWNKTGLKYDKDTTSTTAVDTRFGKFSMSRGRGEGPNITTREADFGGAKMGTTYKALVSGLTAGGGDHKRLAAELTRYYDDKDQAPGTHLSTDTHKRAATMFTGITQVSEEKRNPSAAKLARAGLRRIQKGKANFKDVFTGDDAAYVPARGGGTRAYHDILSGAEEAPKSMLELVEDMSDSSDEEDAELGRVEKDKVKRSARLKVK